jgi:hypothetical protein
VEFDGEVLVGSNEPIAIDPNRWMGRLADSRVLQFFGKPLATRIVVVLRSGRPADPDRFPAVRVNRDLFPRDEFRTPSDL